MTPRPGRFQAAAIGFALACALVCTPAYAYADAAKAAINMSREALDAYEAADYVRAGSLYDQAYKTDSRPEFLFGAARSAHLRGDLPRADEIYRKFIGLPEADAGLVKKAKGYLADLKLLSADAKARDAESCYTRSDSMTAARLWQDAFAVNPKRVDWLARSGHAQAEAGDTSAAKATYRRYLKEAPPQAADRTDVTARLAALEAGQLPAVSPRVSTARTDSAAGRSSRKIGGWSVIAIGGGAGLGGLALFLWANGDQTTLQTAYENRNSAGHIVGLTPQDASARQTSIDNRDTAALILGGVGIAALGIGSWLVLGDKADLALVPTSNGASLTVGWR